MMMEWDGMVDKNKFFVFKDRVFLKQKLVQVYEF